MNRATKQRDAIRSCLERAARPLSPQEILNEASPEVPGLGLATVYRTLRMLTEEGFITAVELPGEPARYELASVAHSHHHHFHCETCDRVFDVEGCPSGIQQLLPRGFTLRRHEITLHGMCKQCAKAS
ncbi:MAG: Fur family transcriptional regulator [Planctomycetota bacterium]|nr:Fur family transcriptional regulator [Planctomycetota bacterium]